jgi:RNA polymerase sigma-70 factor (ECF subfamily)
VSDVENLRGWLTTVVARVCGQLFAVIGFTIANGRIAEMNILADPDRRSTIDLSAIERPQT